jgi:hypothetical protein
MYNTDFEVKYYDIEQELIFKLKNKTDISNSNNNEEPDNHSIEDEEAQDDYEYTSDDIITICDKLYCDELLSVFYAESIFDDKLDKNMQYALEQMNYNQDFKNIFDETKHLLYLHELDQTKHLPEEQKKNVKDNYDFVVLLTLFSQTLFYITHKCVCQQLTTGTIDKNLLNELKTRTIEVLNDKNKNELE